MFSSRSAGVPLRGFNQTQYGLISAEGRGKTIKLKNPLSTVVCLHGRITNLYQKNKACLNTNKFYVLYCTEAFSNMS